jgi:uncharacterized membrane protein YedE/YeeE
MKSESTALLSGTLFGAGLALSQMTNPAKVIAFLDVTGSWDPSLAFVMGAALVIAAGANAWERRRERANNESQAKAAAGSHEVPRAAARGPRIDVRLLLGAALFGIGWGLAGFCPGPALAAIVTGSPSVLLFVASMAAGMGLYRIAVRAPLPRERATH